MGFEESHVVLVVRPFAEEVEGSIEEAVHDGKHPGEVSLVEKATNNQEQTDWHIEGHFEDE